MKFLILIYKPLPDTNTEKISEILLSLNVLDKDERLGVYIMATDIPRTEIHKAISPLMAAGEGFYLFEVDEDSLSESSSLLSRDF